MSRHPVGPSWEICHKIAQGSFGKVYMGINAITKDPVAVKMEPLDVRHPQLDIEADIYMGLRGAFGVPKLLWHGHVDKKFDAIVIDLLGPDLDQLLTYCDTFSLKTVLLIADQLIDRLKTVHKLGFVYRDIKPQNFAIGYGADGMGTVHIMDFGLAKRLLSNADGRPRRKKSGGLVGTARYASISAHRGDHATCANDLESVGYMMMYWLRGALPWSGLKARNSVEKYEKIMRKKLSVPLKELCKGHPDEMIEFIQYCRAYTNEQGPLDYEFLRRLISQMALAWTDDDEQGGDLSRDTFDWFEPQVDKSWPDTSLPNLGDGTSVHPLGTGSTAQGSALLSTIAARAGWSRPQSSGSRGSKGSKYAVRGGGGEQESSRGGSQGDARRMGSIDGGKRRLCQIL
jgi:serine/threonine protein kinase